MRQGFKLQLVQLVLRMSLVFLGFKVRVVLQDFKVFKVQLVRQGFKLQLVVLEPQVFLV